MKRPGPREIGSLLQSGDIGRLAAEAGQRRELAARVRATLPADQAEHVVSAHLDSDGRLVVGMDSAAWAARLRYSASMLLDLPLKVRVSVPGETPA
jgi:hypothetical protein